MTGEAAVPLIVLSPSRDPVEAINAVLRRAGHPVHCTWLPGVRDLADALAQINPEMLVCAPASADDAAAMGAMRDAVAPEVPMLFLHEAVDEAVIAAALRCGARDAVSLGNIERLRAVAERELRAFRLERALNGTLLSARNYRNQLEAVLARSNDAIVQVQEGIVVDANPAWLELFGIEEGGTITGQPLMDLFEDDCQPALKGALVACQQGRWSDHTLKTSARLADGAGIALELLLAAGEFDGEPCVRLIVPARRRDERQLESELADALRRDPGTGLLHRRPLLEALAERLASPARAGVRYLALIRPDSFAEVERQVGVAASEQVLAEFAGLIKAQLAPSDLAGRFGGVSFLLLLERGNERDIEAWSDQLVTRIRRHVFRSGQKTLTLACTLGLAVVPQHDADLDAAIADALEAVRRGRRAGGARVSRLDRSDADTRVQAYDRIWVTHIKAALMANRFRLVQQPIASLHGEDQQMFDVLVRMLDEQGKEVLPSEFMPAAERNDLLRNIDRWVIGASLSFAAQRKPDASSYACRRTACSILRSSPGSIRRSARARRSPSASASRSRRRRDRPMCCSSRRSPGR
ncbi:MAG: diguanylate cyclase [Gammaproteobacteria bacterium]|nr:diguanylate cyclase [Gammaproteobacteria bacterium]